MVALHFAVAAGLLALTVAQPCDPLQRRHYDLKKKKKRIRLTDRRDLP